jgi:hypothetical protein
MGELMDESRDAHELVEYRVKLPRGVVNSLRREAAQRTEEGGRVVFWSALARELLGKHVASRKGGVA